LKITGGFLKGRNLYCPPASALEIRPLRTRIRKALFDILGDDLSGLRVLDLFSGTGALGIEALSRGAEFVLFVDASKKSIELIKKNLERFNLLDKAMILQIALPQGLKKIKERTLFLRKGEDFQKENPSYDLVFITPPYRTGLSLKTLENLPTEILNPKALIVVEEESGVDLPDEVAQFELEDKRAYGETTLYFYRIKA
jgi:16S rRNA (guanine966-N2)-methyltransferase